MAKVEGAEIVWTSADLAALQADKDMLQELIDQIPTSPGVVSKTEFQDPCPAFVRWVVATSHDDQTPGALRQQGAVKKSKATAKSKKPSKR